MSGGPLSDTKNTGPAAGISVHSVFLDLVMFGSPL